MKQAVTCETFHMVEEMARLRSMRYRTRRFEAPRPQDVSLNRREWVSEMPNLIRRQALRATGGALPGVIAGGRVSSPQPGITPSVAR